MDHLQRSLIINIDSAIVYPPDIDNPSCLQGIKLAFARSALVSERHPIVLEYFNSEVALLNEKKRQSKLYQWTIHPLSLFKQYYDIWCFFFYGPLVVLKLMEWSFIRVRPLQIEGILWTIFILDVLSWLDIVLQFFIGYSVAKTKKIELCRKQIAKRYIYSGLFFCDVLSAIPKTFFVYPLLPKPWYLFFNTCILLKLRRTVTFFYSIRSIAYYLNISAQKVFLVSFFFFTMFIMHMMTCLHVGVPQYRKVITGQLHPDSWLKPSFLRMSLREKYVRTFFRTAQYTMLIYLPEIKIPYKLTEEITVGSINYLVGKLMITITWIILLRNFVSQNSVKIKFREVMVELEEYIKAKQIPPELRERLLTYYMYKYQRVFFNEKFIKNMFSMNLKKEINVFLCKTLINSVTIFSKLSPKEVEQVITYLVPEIFLPNEIITQSGTPADCMYFLENGTVAVFTPSGKEVGHLQDGAHFGEVAILIKEKHRTATVVAIEISRVYKLSKSNFDRCFRNNAEVFDALLRLAEERIKEIRELEENYKKILFEMTYKSQK
ncbi:hypothetical protein GWI33_017869 [Rhynchophorus ferrugineus]|uniref:Cyclic nucleotide-binding domain-containing protein n=1 Tax=Rhynchophorus ferrugineus TaxID=354439 RepID=A0A834HV83_RHYFE|nr:hypothetical protein GWI33_017869 [Rhynchophorus ferrugineus]